MEHGYFPLFIDLSEKRILVVGAGNVALRRILVLLEFAASVYVVAPEALEQIEALASQGLVCWKKRPFMPEDLKDMDMVLAASNDSGINDEVARLCRIHKIMVNHGGDKAQCDFYFPGIVKKQNLVVGVTASGKNHKEAKNITEDISRLLKGNVSTDKQL